MGVYNHEPEKYERAMEMRGRVSSMVASRITGVPAPTIKGWWRGQRPKFVYTAMQRGVAQPRAPRKRMSPAEKAQARRENNRRWYYRSGPRSRFHPKYNPDPMIAPLHHLWLRGEEVLAFVLDRFSAEEINQQCPQYSTFARRWWELRTGKEWLRLDSMDAFFVNIGLVLSEMPGEP